LVELRETSGSAASATQDKMINRQAGFLKSDGQITGMNGTDMIYYAGSVSNNLYVVIWHRNHLAIMTSGPLIGTGGVYSWDFTNQQDKAYNNGQKQIGEGVYGMIGGDSDPNRIVDEYDKDPAWKSEAGNFGYLASDLNLDTQVNNQDKDEIWVINVGAIAQLPAEIPFSCGSNFFDIRDGQTYSTVQIGTRCWMAENMNIGTVIPKTIGMTNNAILERYCYSNNVANCDVYGGLYQWDEMMQYTTQPGVQGICPEDFHVPTDAEYALLTNFLGGKNIASGKMKEVGTLHWHAPNTGATNESGFTALPGDHISGVNLTLVNLLWTSSENSTDMAWHRGLLYSHARINRSEQTKISGYTVRCIRDYLNQPPTLPASPQPTDGAINQIINTITLYWTSVDPDNDPVTYDVYFGTTNPPSQVSLAQSLPKYCPGTLLGNTQYYWKIVTHDDHGHTTEGATWTFTTSLSGSWQCGDLVTDSRDNQTYTTVQIGDQRWMAENLNIGSFIQGFSYPNYNSIIEKYCYSNNIDNCEVYGGMYAWEELMQYILLEGTQGICPANWHIPSDAEWCDLTQTIDLTVNCSLTGWSGTDVGTKMKSTTGWSGGGNGTNTSGFNALPAGYSGSGSFYLLGSSAYFSTSTENSIENLWQRNLSKDKENVLRSGLYKDNAASVRCIKD
jgi:uncharacterized protein (TIGR02145 family)